MMRILLVARKCRLAVGFGLARPSRQKVKGGAVKLGQLISGPSHLISVEL